MASKNTTAGELGGRAGGGNGANQVGQDPAGFNADSTRSRVNRQLWVGGKCVGYVVGEVYHKAVRSSQHQLRKPPAWACDAAVLREAERAGAVLVELEDQDTGKVWRATLAAFREKGFKFNRGFGDQVGLPLEHWKPASVNLAVQLGFDL